MRALDTDGLFLAGWIWMELILKILLEFWRKKIQTMCDGLLNVFLDWRFFLNSMRSRNNDSIWNMVRKTDQKSLEYVVDLWSNSSIKFHILYIWINMIKISMLILTKILLEFYDKHLEDVWYIYLKDCRLKIQHEYYKGNN